LIEIRKHSGEFHRIGNAEIPVAVIDQNRDRLIQPGRADNQINNVVAVNVARRDLQSANRSVHADGLPRARAQAEIDPVARMRRADQPSLDGGKIRPIVPIEIRDREMRSRGSMRQHIRSGHSRLAAAAQAENRAHQQQHHPPSRPGRVRRRSQRCEMAIHCVSALRACRRFLGPLRIPFPPAKRIGSGVATCASPSFARPCALGRDLHLEAGSGRGVCCYLREVRAMLGQFRK